MRSRQKGLLALVFCSVDIASTFVFASVATSHSLLVTDPKSQPDIHHDVANDLYRANVYSGDDSAPGPIPPLHHGCDVLDVPSTASWEKHHENVTKWAKEQLNVYQNSSYESL